MNNIIFKQKRSISQDEQLIHFSGLTEWEDERELD